LLAGLESTSLIQRRSNSSSIMPVTMISSSLIDRLEPLIAACGIAVAQLDPP
jgi:hypothetical protein